MSFSIFVFDSLHGGGFARSRISARPWCLKKNLKEHMIRLKGVKNDGVTVRVHM